MKKSAKKRYSHFPKLITLSFVLLILLSLLPSPQAFAFNAPVSYNSFDISDTSGLSFEVPNASFAFYVNDFANVFSEDEKEQLIDKATLLSDNYDSTQVVVTTIESLEDYNFNPPEDYTPKDLESFEEHAMDYFGVQMYNQYGIGKDDRGVLILLATKDRDVRIVVGTAMEAYITDAKSDHLLDDYAIPYLKENQFAEGLISLQEAVISEIISSFEENGIHSSEIALLPEIATNNRLQTSNSSNSLSNTTSAVSSTNTILLVVLLAIAFLLCILIFFYYKKFKVKEVELKVANKRLEESRSENEILSKKCQSEVQEAKSDAKKQIDSARKPYEDKIAYLNQVHDQATASLREQMLEQFREYTALSTQCTELTQQLETITDRYRRACLLYPDLDDGVSKMIAEEICQQNQRAAKDFDDSVANLICMSPDKDLVDNFLRGLNAYSSLTPEVQAFVTSDIEHLNNLHQESQRLKEEYEEFLQQEQIRIQKEQDQAAALNAEQTISSIISSTGGIGKACYLDSLKRAIRIYENLSSNVRNYFDSSIISQAKNLLRDAQKDYDKEQEIAKNTAKANEVMRTISSVTSSIRHASEHDLSRLIGAKRAYETLSYSARPYFDNTLITSLDHLIRQAQQDQEENEKRRRVQQEDAERRKREEEQRRRSSSSSFGINSSSSGGFGGSRSSSFGRDSERSGSFGGSRGSSFGRSSSSSGSFGGGRGGSFGKGSSGAGGKSSGRGSSRKF